MAFFVHSIQSPQSVPACIKRRMLRIHSTIESKREWYELREDIEQRAVDLALYIIENNATVRDAAGHFGISKSTVHTVVTYWSVFLRMIR